MGSPVSRCQMGRLCLIDAPEKHRTIRWMVFVQRRRFIFNGHSICCQRISASSQCGLLFAEKDKLRIDALIEMAHELIELIHAEESGNEFRSLGIGACGDSGKRVDPVLFYEAETIGVSVGNDIYSRVLPVCSRPCGRWFGHHSARSGPGL